MHLLAVAAANHLRLIAGRKLQPLLGTGVEKVLPICSEQLQRRSVCADDTILVEQQHTLAMGVQQFGRRMETQHAVVLRLRKTQAMFDDLNGKAHHAERLCMQVLRITRYIEYAEHLATRRQNGRGSAAQDTVGFEVVLPAAYRDGLLFCERRADRVGATSVFRPVHAGL